MTRVAEIETKPLTISLPLKGSQMKKIERVAMQIDSKIESLLRLIAASQVRNTAWRVVLATRCQPMPMITD
jgi:hypothetical protein